MDQKTQNPVSANQIREPFRKVYMIGRLPVILRNGNTSLAPIYIKASFSEKENLSIRGVVGPNQSGNSSGSCGQIIISFKEYDHRGAYSLNDIQEPAWGAEEIKALFDIWDRWHLNDRKAGCPHQKILGIKEVSKRCPVCGYLYGHEWLREEVPDAVLEVLRWLPDAKVPPDWV